MPQHVFFIHIDCFAARLHAATGSHTNTDWHWRREGPTAVQGGSCRILCWLQGDICLLCAAETKLCNIESASRLWLCFMGLWLCCTGLWLCFMGLWLCFVGLWCNFSIETQHLCLYAPAAALLIICNMQHSKSYTCRPVLVRIEVECDLAGH